MNGPWRNALVLAIGLMIAGGLILAAKWKADQYEHLRIDSFQEELADLATISETIIANRLRQYDDILLVLREEFVAYPNRFPQSVQFLRSGPLADPKLLVVLIDREGYLTYTDTPNMPARLDLGYRAYFRFFADGGKDSFYIDEPTFGRVTRRYSLPLVRPIYDKQGGFLGVVAISVTQESLAHFGHRLQLSSDTTVTVVNRGGAFVTRSRDLAKVQLKKISPELLAPMLKSNEGVFSGRFALDGIESTFAYKHITDLPLIIYVTSSSSKVLREILVQRRMLLLGSSFISLIILALIVVNLQRLKIRELFIATQHAHIKEAQRIARMGSWELNLETFKFQWSDEVYLLFGVSREAFKPDLENFLSFVPENGRAVVRAGIEQAAVEGDCYMEHSVLRGDGQLREMIERGEVVRSAAGKAVALIGTVQDITESKKMEEELLRAQKLESIGHLAGGIAHDFNNLLSIIIGNIELAKNDIKHEIGAFENLKEAENATLQAKGLTKQLITFSKGGLPAKEVGSIGELVMDATNLSLSGSSIKCTFLIPNDLWPVDFDKGQMKHAVKNMIVNAAESMPDGGTINVTAENFIVAAERKLPLPEGKYVKISIRDQGVGIPEEHLSMIFDPYFSTKEMGIQKGMGLGLATTYSIISRHDGHITVESEVGAGTTFTLYLPAHEKDVKKVKLKEISKPEKSAIRTGRILLMDDEEMIRKFGKQVLNRFGYHAELAKDGVEAIELYKNAIDSGKPFEAVILDLTIKEGTGGADTIKKLKEIDPQVRAIVSSGYSNNPVMEDFRQYGFMGALTKPYTMKDLDDTLNKVLGKG